MIRYLLYTHFPAAAQLTDLAIHGCASDAWCDRLGSGLEDRMFMKWERRCLNGLHAALSSGIVFRASFSIKNEVTMLLKLFLGTTGTAFG